VIGSTRSADGQFQRRDPNAAARHDQPMSAGMGKLGIEKKLYAVRNTSGGISKKHGP
jgi:hypothetical protein